MYLLLSVFIFFCFVFIFVLVSFLVLTKKGTKMPKIVTPLTLGQIKAAKPKDKIYKLSDGGGLALWVLPSGKKSWRWGYRFDGRENTVVIGMYPDVSLADARDERERLAKILKSGKNPKRIEDTGKKWRFESRFVEWWEHWSEADGKTGDGKNKRYAKMVWAAAEANILPHLSGKDVRKIQTNELVTILRKIEQRGALEQLRRVRGNLNLFFDFLVADGTIQQNPVSIIGKQVFRRPKKRNFAALDYSELPILVDKLETGEISEKVKLMIYWQLLSMTRPSETAAAEFAEIDMGKKNWEIPIARMKTRPHIVPLSDALIGLLDEIRAINVNGRYLFEGVGAAKPVSSELARLRLRGLGLDTTAHGLRALARTYLREVHKIRYDVGELLLSHAVGSSTERAYNRMELLDERRDALNLLGNDVMELRKKYAKK